MTTAYDVPAEPLIQKMAVKLKERPELSPPEWSAYVKTGANREKPPQQKDWWHVRLAAILRKVYIQGPIGTERLSAEFGGNKNRGSKPNRVMKGSGSIVRKSLMQLEKAGLLTSVKGKGRVVTPAGQKFVDTIAHELHKELALKNPELGKY